jgi:hypothetical protein
MFFQNVTRYLRFPARLISGANLSRDYMSLLLKTSWRSLLGLANLAICISPVSLRKVLASSADRSLTPAKLNMQFSRGEHTGAIRCTCAISAASAGLPATQNCQFSALLPHSRQSFRREICKFCKNCNSYQLIVFPS